MQSLVNIIRGTGASNVIWLPGLGYANMLSCNATTNPTSCGMLAAATPPVTDPNNNLVASIDVYPEGNECGQQLNTSCYDATYKPVAQVMPLVAGESGESPSNPPGPPLTYVNMFLTWMDSNGNGYNAWAWDSWAGLVPGYGDNNTPSTGWGTDYYDHINNITLPPPAQPTDGITFAQVVPSKCVDLSNGSINLASAVNAGDDLFAVFGGQGYTGAASTVDSVSDNVNGAWTRVAWSGSHATGSNNASYSVFELLNAKVAASGLTLTVNGTAGQSGASGVVIDTRGVASVATSSYQSALQNADTTFTGPTLNSVPANDVVLGLWGAYSSGQSFSAPTNWNTSYSYQASNQYCAAGVFDWSEPITTSNVTPTLNSPPPSVPYYGAAVDLHP
jgi:hypothetical protein